MKFLQRSKVTSETLYNMLRRLAINFHLLTPACIAFYLPCFVGYI